MSATTLSQKQQFEELITSLVNLWLKMKMIEHDYKQEKLLPEVTRFFDIHLRKIYNLVENGFIVAYNDTDSRLVQKDVVIKFLQSRIINESREEEQSDDLNRVRRIRDDFAVKTDLRKWIHEKYTERKQMGMRLFNILHTNSRHLDYVEHVDKESFFQCRNAGGKAWQEFVNLRGY